MGDSILHQCDFKRVSIVTNTAIKSKKAYSSIKDDVARYPNMNIEDMTKTGLKDTVDHLVIGAPTVDISNLNTSKLSQTDDTVRFAEKVNASCMNLMNTAENSLSNYPTLKRVTIIPHAPRFDTERYDPTSLKPKLAKYANSVLHKLCEKSIFKDKIYIGSHELSSKEQKNLFVDEITGRYDGVHMYSRKGKQAFTESMINILLSSLNEEPKSQPKQQQQNVYEVPSVSTHNRFSPLGN